MQPILIGNDGFTIEALAAISRNENKIALTEEAAQRIEKSRRLVEKWVEEGRTIYGITTGFGALSSVTISQKKTRVLQKNIIQSHAAGVGPSLPQDVVRAMMVLRIRT